MNRRRRQSGVTLTEVTMVVAAIVVLFGIALPATKTFFRSFQTETSARTLISGAMATARTMALQQQRYVGVRFQLAYGDGWPLNAKQYMTFIIQEPGLVWYDGFKALPDRKPMELPETMLVSDLIVFDPNLGNRNVSNPANSSYVRLDDPSLADPDVYINTPWELVDTTTFSIVFSPAGKAVVHGVRVRNKNGLTDSDGGVCVDDIFNRRAEVENGQAMFYQDDYWADGAVPEAGLGPEGSRMGFVIVDKETFKQAYRNGTAWTDCLRELASEVMYVSPYTGRVISSD